MITDSQQQLLKQYKDKAYINALLAEESTNYYNFIPLIICNTAMVCINSIIVDQDLLKILNIILNSSTGLILSLISNFKLYEHIQQYHQLQIKFNKLCHLIDSKMTNDLQSINNDFISNVVKDYDQICESIEFSYPNSIKKRIKKQYEGKVTLPSYLSIDIVNLCDNNSKCCGKVSSLSNNINMTIIIAIK